MNLYWPCNQLTGEHVFIWSCGDTSDLPHKSLKCSCGAFSFGEYIPMPEMIRDRNTPEEDEAWKCLDEKAVGWRESEGIHGR